MAHQPKREKIHLKQSEEIVIKVLNRSYIVRGIGPRNKGGLQIFPLAYHKGKIWGGSTDGIVQGHSIGVGHVKDIIHPETIQTLEI